jgi:flagellar hook-associated protein 3 FlgL
MSSASFLNVPELLQRRRLSADNALVKQQLQKAQKELTTGLRQDRVSATNGDTSKLMALERLIGAIDGRATNLGLDKARAATMQSAFDTIMSTTEKLPALFWGEKAAPNNILVDVKGLEAETALRHALDTLNGQFGGRGLFNGSAGPGAAFAAGGFASAAAQIVDVARQALNAGPTPAAALTAVDDFFNAGAAIGGLTFDGDFWAGSGAAPSADFGSDKAAYAVRGDAQAVKDLLRGLALAAALPSSTFASNQVAAEEILNAAGSAVATGRDGIALEQARLGAVEARIDEVLTRDAAERTTLSIARMDLIGRDQYDAAVEVQELENRLQMIYAITARTAELSFVNFFR